MSSSRRVENLTGSAIFFADLGVEVAALSTYDITPEEHPLWANSDEVKTSFDAGDIKFFNLGADTVAQLVMENVTAVDVVKSNQDFTIGSDRVLVVGDIDIFGTLNIDGELILA